MSLGAELHNSEGDVGSKGDARDAAVALAPRDRPEPITPHRLSRTDPYDPHLAHTCPHSPLPSSFWSDVHPIALQPTPCTPHPPTCCFPPALVQVMESNSVRPTPTDHTFPPTPRTPHLPAPALVQVREARASAVPLHPTPHTFPPLYPTPTCCLPLRWPGRGGARASAAAPATIRF